MCFSPFSVICDCGWVQGALTATEFHTEVGFDYVRLNGDIYMGMDGPDNVLVRAGSSFTWRSDGSVTNSGWTICWAVGTFTHLFLG